MEDNKKVSGAKQSVQTMLFYYLSSIIGTVPDPKQYIATELGKMIDLSEEQIRYVQMNIKNESKMLDNLSSSVQLLESIEKTGKLDLESINIVKQILLLMQEQCRTALDNFTESVGDKDEGQGQDK